MFYHFSTALLQLVYHLSTTVLPYNISTTCLPRFYSCSTTFLPLFYHLYTTLIYHFPATFLPLPTTSYHFLQLPYCTVVCLCVCSCFFFWVRLVDQTQVSFMVPPLSHSGYMGMWLYHTKPSTAVGNPDKPDNSDNPSSALALALPVELPLSIFTVSAKDLVRRPPSHRASSQSHARR